MSKCTLCGKDGSDGFMGDLPMHFSCYCKAGSQSDSVKVDIKNTSTISKDAAYSLCLEYAKIAGMAVIRQEDLDEAIEFLDGHRLSTKQNPEWMFNLCALISRLRAEKEGR